ncbi:MAG: proline racemase family protein [Actinobacteria bacterium]|nr:proline racemase family protein [Actinomycetota bacterium]
MQLSNLIHAVDAHAEGEPSRIVLGGVLDVPGTTMAEKAEHLEVRGDELRRFLLHEPRGLPSLAADLVFPSADPRADAGIVIMGASNYFPMSGTNLICSVTVLLETGTLPMREPVTEVTLETPAGIVRALARCEEGRCRSVSFANVPSFVTELDRAIEVPGLGTVVADIAWGGAFFALVDATSLGFSLVPDEAPELGRIGEQIKRAAAEQVPVSHPEREAGDTIIFTHFHGPARNGGDGRSANIVSPGRSDRSPCGTGTAAKLAVAHARGELALGVSYVNESILATTFSARILEQTTIGPYPAVVTEISGRAWITGVHQLGRDPEDPVGGGYMLADIWGAGAAAPLAEEAL